MTDQLTGTTNDKRDGPMATAGKQFYSWATIISFGGATAIVVTAWTVLTNLDNLFASQWTPFVASFVVVGAIALFSEPSNRTRWQDKGQKTFQAVVNGFMVSSASMGLNGMGTPPDQMAESLKSILTTVS